MLIDFCVYDDERSRDDVWTLGKYFGARTKTESGLSNAPHTRLVESIRGSERRARILSNCETRISHNDEPRRFQSRLRRGDDKAAARKKKRTVDRGNWFSRFGLGDDEANGRDDLSIIQVHKIATHRGTGDTAAHHRRK